MAVYFIQAEDGGPIKIGYAADPEKRLAGLQTSHHRTLVVRRVLEGGVDLEAKLHERFKSARLAGEWFRPIKRVAKFGNCIPQGPKPKKPRVVYEPMLSEREREMARSDGEHAVAKELGRLMRSGGLLSTSEILHLARLVAEPPHMVIDDLIIPSLEVKIAYLDHYGPMNDERLEIYRSLLRREKEKRA